MILGSSQVGDKVNKFIKRNQDEQIKIDYKEKRCIEYNLSLFEDLEVRFIDWFLPKFKN